MKHFDYIIKNIMGKNCMSYNYFKNVALLILYIAQ